jgi:HEAT repeat protein
MAVEQIRKVRSRRATVFLVKALKDTDPRVRSTAAIGLARRESSATIGRHLAATLENERWPMVARVVAEAIGHHCTPRGNASLKMTLQRGLEGADGVALLSLARCAPPELGRQLIAIIRSDTWRVPLRRHAVALMTRELARRHAKQLVSIFTELRQHAARNADDEMVAGALTRALALLDSAPADDALADALALDPHESIRAAAAMAIALRCAPVARGTQPASSARRSGNVKQVFEPALRRAANDSSALVRRATASALKKCNW